MEIRKKLTYLFVGIVALILLFSSLAIYYFSADHREEDFYNRLHDKGRNTAKLLLEVEEVDAALLQKIEAGSPQSLHEEKLLIYNYKDEILYSSDDFSELTITSEILDRIRLEDEIRYSDKGHEVLGFMFLDTYDRFVVIAAAKDVVGFRKISNLRLILIIVFAGGVVIATLLGWVYAGRALNPISKVVSEVEQISIANLDRRIDEGNSQDEIARLASTFNKMLSRLEKAFTMQKNFIANASHELRTPLTVITGQLEVMLMQERTSDEYRQTMVSVFEDIKNLNTTSNRLLLLAQANSEIARKDIKPVRIDEVAWLARTEVLKRDSKYNIDIVPDEGLDDAAKLTVNGNEQLLKTAITNLLDNGCKYSDNHHVRLDISFAQNQVILKFSDKGIGIPKEDIKRIFEPFHRAGNAITYKGHGIGLSLVARIAELHEGIISVESEPEKGTVFTFILNTFQD